jgi:hypothetical protein
MGVRLGHGLAHHEFQPAVAVEIAEAQPGRTARSIEAEGADLLRAAGRLSMGGKDGERRQKDR